MAELADAEAEARTEPDTGSPAPDRAAEPSDGR
jgi:hypothetical protein